jgi:hypothetical protein
MIAEIPYMLVWGFFSAMGWMGANWTVEKVYPDKEKDKPAIVQPEKKENKENDK